MIPSKKNARELKFIEEYLLDGNATQAAIRAGYSTKTAHVQGSQLLRKLKVAVDSRLAQQHAAIRKEVGVTKERLIREIACTAFLDMGKCYDNHGNPIEIPDLPANVRRALSGFEFYEEFLTHKKTDGDQERTAVGVTKKFKFHDKTRAQELLAKLLGFFPKEGDKGPKDSMTLEELVLGSMELEEEEKRK